MADDVYLLDTCIASILWDELHDQHVPYQEKAKALGDAPLYVSVVTLAEVEWGMQLDPDVARDRHDITRKNMATYEVMPLNRDIARTYARLKARLFNRYAPRNKKGKLKTKWVGDLRDLATDKSLGIQENDLWQVSFAMSRNYMLLTNDRMSRLREIAGDELRVLDWRE